MIMRYLFASVGLLVLLPLSLNAQVILKRQVLSSYGGSGIIDSTVYISHTFGQPPQAGTVFNDAYLRQGFEQPKGLNECGILNNFIIEELVTECGAYYNIEYTGTTQPNMTYLWNFGENALPQSSTDQNYFDLAFTDTGLQVINLIVTTDDGCSVSASKVLNVSLGGFSSQVTQGTIDCEDESVDILVTTFNGEGPFSIEWEDGNTAFVRNDLGIGNFSYTVTDSRNCTHIDSVVIDFENPQIIIDAEVNHANCDTSVLGSIEITISGGIGEIQIDWSNGSTEQNNTDLTPGNYTVTVTDERFCEETMSYVVLAECMTEDIIPNTISPNGDNINDTWVIPDLENYPNNELEIFNRWGSPIYRAQPYQNDWRGVNDDNEELPFGAYYYVLRLNDLDNTILQGSITIVK